MLLVLLGPPAVGKGTQAVKISDFLTVPHISTGDIFRLNIRKGSTLGIKAAEYINRGQLVPDDITVELVKARLLEDDCKNGWVLDGFPRTLPQAEALDAFKKPDMAISLEASDEFLAARVSGRKTCKNCPKTYHSSTYAGEKCVCGGELYVRDDDKAETFIERLKQYQKQTAPVIDYYKNQGLLKVVSAESDIESVFKLVKKTLQAGQT